MSKLRESFRLSSHWHVDCRLEEELPEDNVVSLQFVVNLLFGLATFSLVVVAGWIAYQAFNQHRLIREWDTRIAESMPQVRQIQALQREYVTEASKIDQAYGAIRPTLFISQFIRVLGETLPSQIGVETLEWNDTDVIMRGVLRGSSQQSIRILGDYVDLLRKHDKIGPRFREIRATGFERIRGREDLQNFGIIFRLQPLPPL
jgi:hypothetical protein